MKYLITNHYDGRKNKRQQAKSVPELPIIPAFFTLDVFGSTIIISPEKTWNSGENKNFDFLKSKFYM